MMRVILNGNGTTLLWDLVNIYIKPELLDDETIDAELKDVEEVYKREGPGMFIMLFGVAGVIPVMIGIPIGAILVCIACICLLTAFKISLEEERKNAENDNNDDTR